MPLFRGELGPRLTQRRLDRGLPMGGVYQGLEGLMSADGSKHLVQC